LFSNSSAPSNSSFASKINQSQISDSKKEIRYIEKKNPTLKDMIAAVNNTIVEKAPEEDKEEYLPIKISLDDVVLHQESMNIPEMMKGKLVEDIFEIEWKSVKNAHCGKTGMIKISEGRIVKPIDGTLDYLSEEDSYD
jgi:hypothetical protein